MNVRKFVAPSSREALNKLRNVLGPDAIIISNRQVNGQVEILAVPENEMAELGQAALDARAPAAASARANTREEVEFARWAANKIDEESDVTTEAAKATLSRVAKTIKKPYNDLAAMEPEEIIAKRDVPVSQPRDPEMAKSAELISELRSLRSIMEEQLAEISWGNTQRKEPHKAKLLKEMLSAGFSAGLARHLIENMPKAISVDQSLAWMKTILSKNINTISSDSDMLEKGGVFALVGPTGVGKTTTTAKLAARCVMRHGASKLALITTDGYRIGGYEQLRIYGKILGLMVHAVKDESDVRLALAELKNKHTVLIDTVGMSQRDRLVAEQVAMLSGANINTLLCLNATSTGETLGEVIQSYQGTGLSGCIITKMDEAANIGSVLDVIIRQKLTLFYLANGQRVPEDLHIANKSYLVDHAFKFKREQSVFKFRDDELPMLMANTKAAAAQAGRQINQNDRQLSEVSLDKF